MWYKFSSLHFHVDGGDPKGIADGVHGYRVQNSSGICRRYDKYLNVKSKNVSLGMYSDLSCGIAHYLAHFHVMAGSTVTTIIPVCHELWSTCFCWEKVKLSLSMW